jgi:hypothetical protein
VAVIFVAGSTVNELELMFEVSVVFVFAEEVGLTVTELAEEDKFVEITEEEELEADELDVLVLVELLRRVAR